MGYGAPRCGVRGASRQFESTSSASESKALMSELHILHNARVRKGKYAGNLTVARAVSLFLIVYGPDV